MNFVSVLKMCEAANGAGSKQVIQAALTQADADAKYLITAALDPYQVFGVKQFEMPSKYSKKSAPFSRFLDLLQALSSRTLTGDAARDAVTAHLALYDEETASYLTRVIDKDLRAGFSADSANKAWGSKTIPTFEVMLADKCDSTEDFEKYVTFPCQADWKYDGCLSAAWTIELKDGRTVTIGEFVDGDMEGEVLSYNVTTKKTEFKKIQAKIKNSMPERKYEWFQLTLEDGTVLPPLTGNHRIWISDKKCWRRTDELQVGDQILAHKYHHTSSGRDDGTLDESRTGSGKSLG